MRRVLAAVVLVASCAPGGRAADLRRGETDLGFGAGLRRTADVFASKRWESPRAPDDRRLRYGVDLSRDDGAARERVAGGDDFGPALLLPNGSSFAVTNPSASNGPPIRRSTDPGQDISGRPPGLVDVALGPAPLLVRLGHLPVPGPRPLAAPPPTGRHAAAFDDRAEGVSGRVGDEGSQSGPRAIVPGVDPTRRIHDTSARPSTAHDGPADDPVNKSYP